MATPIEYMLVVNEVESGQTFSVPLDCPGQGQLYKIIVAEQAGSGDGFTADLYNSQRAVYPTASSSSESLPGEDLPNEIFKVIPTLIAAATKNVAEFFEASGMPYINTDYVALTTIPNQLFLAITPGGSGTKSFVVSYLVGPE